MGLRQQQQQRRKRGLPPSVRGAVLSGYCLRPSVGPSMARVGDVRHPWRTLRNTPPGRRFAVWVRWIPVRSGKSPSACFCESATTAQARCRSDVSRDLTDIRDRRAIATHVAPTRSQLHEASSTKPRHPGQEVDGGGVAEKRAMDGPRPASGQDCPDEGLEQHPHRPPLAYQPHRKCRCCCYSLLLLAAAARSCSLPLPCSWSWPSTKQLPLSPTPARARSHDPRHHPVPGNQRYGTPATGPHRAVGRSRGSASPPRPTAPATRPG